MTIDIVSAGPSPASGIAPSRVCQAVDAGPILIIPRIARRNVPGNSPTFVEALMRAYAVVAETTLGLPLSAPGAILEHWRAVGTNAGVRVVRLGDRGWDRAEFADDGFSMESVMLPAELADAGLTVMLLSAERDEAPFEAVRAIIHPRSRLHLIAMRDEWAAVVEPAAALRAQYVVDLAPSADHVRHGSLLFAATSDVLAAEIIALVSRALYWREAGFEERGPWEHPAVQAAAERGIGVPGGFALVLRVARGDDVAERFAIRASELLDCRIEEIE